MDYYAILDKKSKQYPKVTDALMRAARHRLRRWEQYVDTVDLQALDLLLDLLASLSDSLVADGENGDLAFLPQRISDDAAR